MVVVDEIKDYQRYTSLTFTDFLEALGRVADMKSLPLDSDLDAAGYQNILEWAIEKERLEGATDKGQNRGNEAAAAAAAAAAEGAEGGDGAAATSPNAAASAGQHRLDIFRPRESAGFDAPRNRPLYVKLEMLLDLIFRRLYWDPTNVDIPFNYDGLLKLIKKIDKDLGP